MAEWGKAMKHPSISVAVIMERLTLDNKWCSEKWEAIGIIPDISGGNKESRVIFEDALQKQILFPGFDVTLHRDEAEGYYLNLSSPLPKVFVTWRSQDDLAVPYIVTVSYNEAARWMDSNEQVDGVPMPPDIAEWLGDYVNQNYKPEPKKRHRPQSFVSPARRADKGTG